MKIIQWRNMASTGHQLWHYLLFIYDLFLKWKCKCNSLRILKVGKCTISKGFYQFPLLFLKQSLLHSLPNKASSEKFPRLTFWNSLMSQCFKTLDTCLNILFESVLQFWKQWKRFEDVIRGINKHVWVFLCFLFLLSTNDEAPQIDTGQSRVALDSW